VARVAPSNVRLDWLNWYDNLINMVKSDPLRPLGLVATVSDRLRAEIRERHSVGDKLATEAALAERFSISRTVVREAIAALRTEGLLETRQGSGIFVARTEGEVVFRLSRSDGRDAHRRAIYELRFGLEVTAAGLAAVHRSAKDLNVLDAALVAMTVAETRAEADLRFHAAVAAATGNAHYVGLTALLTRELSTLVREARDGTVDYRWPAAEQLLEEHRRVRDAVAAGDADAARSAMAAHLHASARRFGMALRGVGRGDSRAPSSAAGSAA